ncbi:MAG: hypothetical protein ACTSYO_08055 [Candidatus Ranarchaeia archaeon]
MPEKENMRMSSDEDKEHVKSRIIVDLRATGIHKDEIGLHKIELKAQKDRQWTRDADIIGTVARDEQPFARIVLRTKIWETENPLERRLVIKLFTMSDYWRGSIELLQGESILHSFAAEETCISYICMLNGTNTVSRIRQIPQRKRLRGTIFAIDTIDAQGKIKGFIIDDKRLNIGSDWQVKDSQGNIVADIDGKILNIGGRFDIKIYDSMLAADKNFYLLIILFAATLRYEEKLRKTIQNTLKHVSNGGEIRLEESEADLYQNPRKLNY